MTISAQNPYHEFTYAGVGPYSFSFRIDSSSWFKVFVDGVALANPLASGILSRNPDQIAVPGGTYEFNPGVAVNGQQIRFERNVTFEQQVDLGPYTAFPADTIERALDLLTMMAQDLKDHSATPGPQGPPGVDGGTFGGQAGHLRWTNVLLTLTGAVGNVGSATAIGPAIGGMGTDTVNGTLTPNASGTYLVTFSAVINRESGTNDVGLYVYVNDSSISVFTQYVGTTDGISVSCAGLASVTAGQTIRMKHVGTNTETITLSNAILSAVRVA